ncbi:extracellular solute-binding protein [Thalassospira lucentensis]|uniref:extracellular solute-binding protein n=1 Tax=Thalassospira lucentensis TaxID=168935 RepID=UPI0015899A73|nr:extracellular solute-binding protein [Thalassospira lucentensis]
MKFKTLGFATTLAMALSGHAQAETILNVATAGSENMVEYVNQYLAPKFRELHPDVTVRVIGTGPGDAGSNAIMERLSAQKDAGASADIDVAVVHEKPVGKMVTDGLLAKYAASADTASLVSSDKAKNALGVDVDGYVMPMFQSQTAWAYHPALVSNPPKSYAELGDWVKENPGVFGYNGIRNGMSGVSFVNGWMYAFTGEADKMMKGPFDPSLVGSEKWNAALADLKEFNKNVTFTPGNAGTLDMLNRGEIGIGPVWVDMFYSWQADGRVNPEIKLMLPEPGMPGQPMHYVIPETSKQRDLAVDFIELATSPAVQAHGIVEQFNWYPGIDAKYLESELSADVWDKLFADITPEDLATKSLSFPLVGYFDAILTSYERDVE